MAEQKNHSHKRALVMQDKEALNPLTLEAEQFQWVHKIEIIHFHLIKKKKF